jgi:serine-type D-Ala-D-Ala carboxypeptidase
VGESNDSNVRVAAAALFLALAIIVGAGSLMVLGRQDSPGQAAGDLAGEEGEFAAPRFDPADLEEVVRPVAEGIENGSFPGAAIAIGVRAGETHLFGYGAIGWTRNAAPVDPYGTIYDLASVTKVVATASAVMLLVEEGRMGLDDPLHVHVPEFRGGPKDAVTIRHLLTHTSGLPAGATLASGRNRAERIARAASFSIFPPAGARVEYSDVGYILLGEAVERAAGEPLPQYLERRLFRPLGMNSTGFSPGLDCEACAPTGRLRDQSLYRGRPFDPLAQRLDGISGNSGLFSTAHDLARFAAMITNGGELDGVRVMKPETVAEFVGLQPVGGRYRLGWQVLCGEEGGDDPDRCTDVRAIGHNGWTGTSFWIDPAEGIWVILLTNRTYEPRGSNRIQQIRRDLFSRATSPPANRIAGAAQLEHGPSDAGGDGEAAAEPLRAGTVGAALPTGR